MTPGHRFQKDRSRKSWRHSEILDSQLEEDLLQEHIRLIGPSGHGSAIHVFGSRLREHLARESC
jgi:hypothetical protein